MTSVQKSSRVPDCWYSFRKIGEGIRLITEIHVARWLRCNIWHIEGRDSDLLIDSGMGLRPLKPELARLSEKPLKCISTHCHFDHIGGAHEFDCRLGHRLEQDVHSHPTLDNTVASSFVRAETFLALPQENFDFRQYSVRPAPLTGYLDEGDVLDLGNRVFQILHLPGHSPGSIALWEEATGILFSGDTVYDGDLFDSVYHSDRDDYRESLIRLREMPVSVVHGGHERSFDRKRMIQIIDEYFNGRGVLGDVDSWIKHSVRSFATENRM